MNWQIEAARLRNNTRKLIAIMDENVKRNPAFYRERLRLLDEFFAEHSSPIDITFVLYGALADAHELAYHLEGNNLLFYRPMASHKRTVAEAFLRGRRHPERTVLIFDNDMVTGSAMTETANFLTRSGYDRSRIFGYLDWGCDWRKYGTPELMHIDDLLKK